MNSRPDSVWEDCLIYLGRGPFPYGNGPRRSETSADPPAEERRRAVSSDAKFGRSGKGARSRD